MQPLGSGAARPRQSSASHRTLAVGPGWKRGSFAAALAAGRLGEGGLEWRERLAEALEPIEHGAFDTLLLELDSIEPDSADAISTVGRLAPGVTLIALVVDDTGESKPLPPVRRATSASTSSR